jgi:hypothetical protein
MCAESPPQPPDSARRQLGEGDLERAEQIIDLAWEDLPATHRALLEAIGAAQRRAVDGPLGQEVVNLRRSAGHPEPDHSERQALDAALGVWVPDLRVVLVDAGHEKHVGLDETSYEAALARVAWHEWGHALSLDRATNADIEAGDRLLELAPEGVSAIVRGAGYRSRERTHELVAEIYALLMARRRRGETGQPPWLDDEIWSLMKRVTEWGP